MEESIHKKEKYHLSLAPVSEGLKIGIKRNGKPYSVRDDRSRYFFPNEWLLFYNALKKENQLLFDTLINTGARIDEALNIRAGDFDWERNNLTLKVTKIKSTKGETSGKKRTFTLSSEYASKVSRYVTSNGLKKEDLIFKATQQGTYQLMKRVLKKIGINDWQQFALHNIRKTHGNWLKALEVDSDEICLRLGHDHNTYLKHYGSASIFDRKDKQLMIKILGDVYGIK